MAQSHPSAFAQELRWLPVEGGSYPSASQWLSKLKRTNPTTPYTQRGGQSERKRILNSALVEDNNEYTRMNIREARQADVFLEPERLRRG